MSSPSRFPSESAIISYLENYPLTCSEIAPTLSEEGMIKIVAESFSNKINTPAAMDLGM